MDPFTIALISLFSISAVAYLALIHKLPFKGDFALKAVPALTLAVASATMIPGTVGMLLCLGFVLSALGDIALSFQGEKFFLGGLVSFLLAHVVYIVTFTQDSTWTMHLAWLLAVLGVFGAVMVYVLTPHLGQMKIPVYVYISVILTMDTMAVLRGGPAHGLLIAGALTFTVSDTFLAMDRFRKPIAGAKYWVMTTYYAGQAMICLAHVCGYLPSCGVSAG